MTGIAIRSLGVTVRVATDDARLIADLHAVFRCFDTESSADETPAHDALVVASPDERTFVVTRGDEALVETSTYPFLVASVAYAVYGEVRSRATDHLLLHAGAVATGGAGVLLAGDKERGKSTLVAHLVKEGYAYLTDDMAPIDLDSGDLVSFPRAIDLRGESPSLLSPSGDRLNISPYGGGPEEYGGRYALPADDALRRDVVAPSVLIFSQWIADTTTKLEPIGRAQAGGELMRVSANMPRLEGRGFEAVGRLAARTRAFKLEYGDLDGALDAVRAALASESEE